LPLLLGQPLLEQPLMEMPLLEQPLLEQPLLEQPLLELPPPELPPPEPPKPPLVQLIPPKPMELLLLGIAATVGAPEPRLSRSWECRR
jgi:hypothetical protein